MAAKLSGRVLAAHGARLAAVHAEAHRARHAEVAGAVAELKTVSEGVDAGSIESGDGET